LLQQNKLGTLLKSETIKNPGPDETKISLREVEYGHASGLAVLPTVISTAKGDGNGGFTVIEDRVEFTYGNLSKNLIGSQALNGPPTAYVWGYNNQYLVAQVSNATSNQVMATSIDTSQLYSLDSSDEAKKTELAKLRSELQGAMVTSYLYRPSVGISSQIDSRGHTSSYEYDSYNRLKRIRDDNDKIVQEFDYGHYSAPIVTPEDNELIIGSISGKNKLFINEVESFAFQTNGQDSNYSYQWFLDGAPIGTTQQITHTFPSTDTYELILEVTDANSQSSRTFQRQLVVYQHLGQPTITASKETMYLNETSQITASNIFGGSGSYDYEWLVNGVVQNESSLTFEFEPSDVGEYEIGFR
jgi:YD repeat-containing protein